jgi:hypothetical protein
MDMAINKREFRKWQKEHPNFMTPTVLKVVPVGKQRGIELSQGEDFDHKAIYGVSLFKRKKEGGFQTGFKGSKMFHNRLTAEEYIKSKKRK